MADIIKLQTSLFTGFEETIDPNDVKDEGVVIHPQALVEKGAELGRGVHIGPRAMVGSHVKLGDDVRIGAGATITGRATIGQDTIVFPFATIGSVPQDLKFKGEDTEVIIGEGNRIREYVNISLGTVGGGGKTQIGDHNLVMVYTHIGHDCIVNNHCIFANGVQLAGHVEVGNGVVFGGLSAAHQFTQYGDMAMIAAGAMVSQDVPPFCMVHGDRAKVNGLNVVGLRRAKLKNLSDIKAMYRLVYGENITLTSAVERIEAEVPASAARDLFVSFLRQSQRGIVR